MQVLLLASAYNCLCKHVHVVLMRKGHQVSVELALSEELIRESVQMFQPELIICPFLMHFIPNDIWQKHKCLIVHPGIVGDRGPSSLDWAILQGKKEWGVTLLEASEEFDAGDIWATENFPMRQASKSSLYRDEVSKTAARLSLQVVEDMQNGTLQPFPLDYSRDDVHGTWNPPMRQNSRLINWDIDPSWVILQKIRSADSSPGLLDSKLFGEEYFLYHACEEEAMQGKPGEVIARRNGAICVGTVDESAIWIGHLKKRGKDANGKPHYKLPATLALKDRFKNSPEIPLAPLHSCKAKTYKEIWYEEENDVGYLYFEFYSGAMSTDHCLRLKEAFLAARLRKTKAIVLMGGRDFWSNGIHLNVIEAAEDPAEESWRNINAIDDLVQAILTTTSHLTIAAMQGSAGAGGVMFGIAADQVYLASSVILSPHYKGMGKLYGSEYWTYSLPKRVGRERADSIVNGLMPMGAEEALEIGMVDRIVDGDETGTFRTKIGHIAEEIAQSPDYDKMMAEKLKRRQQDEQIKPLSTYRYEELEEVKKSFFGPDPVHHNARRDFVCKKKLTETPAHFAIHRKTKASG